MSCSGLNSDVRKSESKLIDINGWGKVIKSYMKYLGNDVPHIKAYKDKEGKVKVRVDQTRVDRDTPRNLEFGPWFMDFGLLLWTENDSGLPTRPITITKTLKTIL